MLCYLGYSLMLGIKEVLLLSYHSPDWESPVLSLQFMEGHLVITIHLGSQKFLYLTKMIQEGLK